MDIILYGAGKRCKNLIEALLGTDIHIRAIIDQNPEKWGTYIASYEISSVEKLSLFQGDAILFCIAIADHNIVEQVRHEIVDKYDFLMEIDYFELIRKAYENTSFVKDIILENPPQMNPFVTVVFDCLNGLGLGGIEEWTKALCKRLKNENISKFKIISKEGKYILPSEIQDNIKYLNVKENQGYSKNTIIEVLKSYLESMPCTVVTSQPYGALMIAGFLKRYYPDKVRIVSVIHGGTEQIYQQYMVYADVIDEFVCVSKDIETAMKSRGCEHVHAITCPVACDVELKRNYTGNKQQPIQIGYAGRLEIQQKRMDLLLKVIHEMKDSNCHFNIAGGGTALEYMEEYIDKNNLDKRVSFLGELQRNEISDFWKKQDIYINLADYEGRSISQLEAMANGAIPVCTQTSGTREDIENGINGFYVSIGNYKGIVESIEYLCQHREVLCTMGKKSHDIIYKKCSDDQHLIFWKELLRRQEWSLLPKQ